MLLAFIKSIEPKLKKTFFLLFVYFSCLSFFASLFHQSFWHYWIFGSPSDTTLLLSWVFLSLYLFYLSFSLFFFSIFSLSPFSLLLFLFSLLGFFTSSFSIFLFSTFFSYFFHFFSSSFLLFICSLFLYVYIKPGSWINIREGLKNS